MCLLYLFQPMCLLKMKCGIVGFSLYLSRRCCHHFYFGASSLSVTNLRNRAGLANRRRRDLITEHRRRCRRLAKMFTSRTPHTFPHPACPVIPQTYFGPTSWLFYLRRRRRRRRRWPEPTDCASRAPRTDASGRFCVVFVFACCVYLSVVDQCRGCALYFRNGFKRVRIMLLWG